MERWTFACQIYSTLTKDCSKLNKNFKRRVVDNKGNLIINVILLIRSIFILTLKFEIISWLMLIFPQKILQSPHTKYGSITKYPLEWIKPNFSDNTHNNWCLKSLVIVFFYVNRKHHLFWQHPIPFGSIFGNLKLNKFCLLKSSTYPLRQVTAFQTIAI